MLFLSSSRSRATEFASLRGTDGVDSETRDAELTATTGFLLLHLIKCLALLFISISVPHLGHKYLFLPCCCGCESVLIAILLVTSTS